MHPVSEALLFSPVLISTSFTGFNSTSPFLSFCWKIKRFVLNYYKIGKKWSKMVQNSPLSFCLLYYLDQVQCQMLHKPQQSTKETLKAIRNLLDLPVQKFYHLTPILEGHRELFDDICRKKNTLKVSKYMLEIDQTYIKPFSLSHFSKVRFRIVANRLKNWCCSGLAVLPGPLIFAYSLAPSTASL